MDEHSPKPANRYEKAAEQDRRQQREAAQEILAEPLGSFTVKQLAWGALGFALGLVLANLTWAVVNLVVFTAAGFVGRAYLRHRYGREEPRRDA
ncbi:hypothetical protein [Geodermatophilus maliterrae]|uniref:AtpZ/AtpI family protein n=1 Tax=Geodermatophilus maliterrae TaxID=3162531 RepID=A0ABV3XB05_9ACTN